MGHGLSNKMKLSYAEIHNFRSISHIKLFFSPSCRALVGINETGKSNILKALSLLGNKYKPSSDDIRVTLPDEPPVTQAYIRFVFLLSEEDVKQIYEALKKSVFTLNYEKSLISKDGKKLNLQEFCRLRNEGIYYVDLLKKDKTIRYYKLQSGFRTLGNWKKSSDIVTDANFLIETTDGKKLPLEDFSLIDIEDCKEIPHQNFSDITPEYINELVGKEIIKFVKENLPNVILWAYDEKNILPPSVNITTFSYNPDICTPLKNMFYLAKIDDINKEITDSMAGAKPLLRNLLNKVADQSTKHFRQIWKEYKTIEFGLSPNGENIDATIKDTFNHYEMSQRSDGFKRFVSFLLIISALVKTNKLGNTLILIDEPDISLHPSGTRYLRDELIRISKTNFIIYSSHSIFMVDENNIKRHIIVKKENEITSIVDVDDSNIFDEEVIYNALNYSIFEVITKKVILFEGWRDKKLFKVATKKFPSVYKHFKNDFRNIGVCHAKGVKHIKYVTSILEAANRKCLILSDNDAPAKEKQKEFVKEKGHGIWRRYDELLTEGKVVTAEDFLKPIAFQTIISKIKKEYNLPNLSQEELSEPKGKIYSLKKWIEKGGLQIEEREKIIDIIKEHIFDDLKPSHIEPNYYKFLGNLNKILK